MNEQSSALEARLQSFNFCSIDFSALARARARGSQFPRSLLSLENHPEREEKKKRERSKKGAGTPKDKEGVGERTRSRGGPECGPAIIVAFPTDKVTAPEYFLFPAADRARITRKES